MSGVRAALRDARYALPGRIERIAPAPGPGAAARRCIVLGRRGLASTIGYFQGAEEPAEGVVAANLEVARQLAGSGADVYLSVKAPPLGFDIERLRRIAAAGLALTFDAHAPRDADATLEAAREILRDHPLTGLVLPARWGRSQADAEAFRDGTARIRLVKGEWADPDGTDGDVEAAYLALAERLAGRPAPVAVATHDPALAQRALGLLIASGTPCELEQLRGLPSRRTMAVARRLGVKVRVYVPFGPGWWPYALDKALARPYLLSWMIRDRLARPDRPPHRQMGRGTTRRVVEG